MRTGKRSFRILINRRESFKSRNICDNEVMGAVIIAQQVSVPENVSEESSRPRVDATTCRDPHPPRFQRFSVTRSASHRTVPKYLYHYQYSDSYHITSHKVFDDTKCSYLVA